MFKNSKRKIRSLQKQNRPGKESKMSPASETQPKKYKAAGKLTDKVCLITGGDSGIGIGIGKAIALLFAKEGAELAISYLSEDEDALQTQVEIEAFGKKIILIKSNLAKEANCKKAVDKTIKQFGKLDILINNAALHWEADSIEPINFTRGIGDSLWRYFSGLVASSTNRWTNWFVVVEKQRV